MYVRHANIPKQHMYTW